MGKIWKNGGEEDKFIKKLIKKGQINRFTKPSRLKVDYPAMFGDFTGRVLRNHLTSLKRSCGVCVGGESDNENIDDNDEEQVEIVNVEDKNTGNTTSNTFENTVSGINLINHRNYPVICEVYKDPETGCDKVALVITLPAEKSIEISDDGVSSTIKYTWPDMTYDMRELYGRMLAEKRLNIHHPRVLCVKNGLEKYPKRIDAAPESTMKVYLPIKVQTSGDSWSMSGISKDDGTQILMADFTGLVNDYNAKVREVRFD